MPIKTERLGRARYLENWLGMISGNDVVLSAEERKKWQLQDGQGQYLVLIDLSECRTLPPISTLRGAAKIHPKGKAHFILFGGGRFFQMIGEMVGRFTGYYIAFCHTRQEALSLADQLVKSWEVNATSLW